MKKIFYTFIVFALGLTLVACDGKGDNIVISKLFSASRLANNAIELYNNSDKDIDLEKYRIDFYADGVKEVSSTIDLTGSIKANSYYLIIGKNFDSEEFEGVVEKADLVFEKTIVYTGDDAVALAKGKKIVDFIGYNDGFPVNYSKNSAMFRLGEKEDYTPSTTFDEFNFIKYHPNAFKYLKNDDHKIKTLEDLYKGPGLDEKYKDMPYQHENRTSGTGGAPIATLVSKGDGDTSTFDFDEKPAGTTSHRYYYINTPELAGSHTEDEPWGAVASKFTNEFLFKNDKEKEIRVQSVPNGSLGDTFGRNLGLIWIDGVLAQFRIVQEGLSKVDAAYDSTDIELLWHDVPYLTFLVFAQQRAAKNGWGVHGFPNNPTGERAPDWDYGSEKRNPQSMYENWRPHVS